MTLWLLTAVLITQITQPVGTVVENNEVLGPAIPIKYKQCLVVPYDTTQNATVDGTTLNGSTIRKSSRYPFVYVVNHQITNRNFMKVQVGVKSDNPEVSVVHRVGNEWKISKTRINDWSAPMSIENHRVIGYRIDSLPEGVYVGSPVIDPHSEELIGLIVEPSKGEVLPASQLLSDISQVLSDINTEIPSPQSIAKDDFFRSPAISSWKLARGEDQAHSGLSIRTIQEARRNFGLKVENIVAFTSQGTTLFILASNGRIIAFDTLSEQRLWDVEENQLFPLVVIPLNQENLLLLQGFITLETIADFWGDRNRIRDNIGLLHLINSKTGERKQVSRYGFPGAVQVLGNSVLIGGLGYYFFMNSHDNQQKILKVPGQKIDLTRWCMPISADADTVWGVEMPTRLAGRGDRHSPYTLRAEDRLEIVRRKWVKGDVVERLVLGKTTPAQRPMSAWVARIDDDEFIICTNTKLYYCTLQPLSKNAELDFPDGASIVITNEGCVISNEKQVWLVSRDLRSVHWRFISETEISHVLVSQNVVIFATTDGYVYSLNLIDGKINWKIPVGFSVKRAPIAIGSDIWLVSEDYHLLRIRDVLAVK